MAFIGNISGSSAFSYITGITGSTIFSRPGGGYLGGSSFPSLPGDDVVVYISGAIDSKLSIAGNKRFGVTVVGGDLVTSGAFNLEQMTAPSTTTDKLYNRGGDLYWEGAILASGTITSSPAGSDTQYQYNNGDSMGGAADLTFNDSTGDTTVGASTGDAKLAFRSTDHYIYSRVDGDLNIVSDGHIGLTGSNTTATAIGLRANQGGGGISMDTSTGGILLNTSGRLHMTSSVSAQNAVQINASAGGIEIYASGSSSENINILNYGGSVNITAEEDAANAIYLRANKGTSETIKIHSDQGTGTDSIHLLSDAGGITLQSGLDIILNADGGDVHYQFGGGTTLSIDGDNSVIYPSTDKAWDLGKSDARWQNIYTGDLHLANDRGSYTLVEEEHMLTIRNNKNGRWYRLMMEEIDPTDRDAGMAGEPPLVE